jgi:hypothetical protein
MGDPLDARSAFIDAVFWHGSLDRGEAILARHPEVRSSDIHTAAMVGDDEAVRRFLALDRAGATVLSGPRGVDALTHLCFSAYLREDRARSDAFVRAATALLDAGASAGTGFWDTSHQPKPEWESVLYGAAGVAHHAGMTRLLIDRGADPNDEETPYHSPETYDNSALKVLVESGRLTADSLTTMLLRKADWHDLDGITYLLDHGADPNRMTRWKYTALHQGIWRDNNLPHIEAMLDHGGDPAIVAGDGLSGVSMAARRGRGDVLRALDRRSIPVELHGVERLIAACARDDAASVQTIADREPGLVRELLDQGGTLLAQFAGTANTAGVSRLLDLGVAVDARYAGDPYFGIAADSTALHVAAWRAWHETVGFLLERGASVNARDGQGRTPLALAVRACVDSYWWQRRSPDSIEALLRAGASTEGVRYPSGYAAADELIRRHRTDNPHPADR